MILKKFSFTDSKQNGIYLMSELPITDFYDSLLLASQIQCEICTANDLKFSVRIIMTLRHFKKTFKARNGENLQISFPTSTNDVIIIKDGKNDDSKIYKYDKKSPKSLNKIFTSTGEYLTFEYIAKGNIKSNFITIHSIKKGIF